MKFNNGIYAYLAAAIFLGAGTPIAYKLATGMSIPEFMFLAYFISTIFSFGLIVIRGKQETLLGYLKNKKDLLYLGVIGILSYALLGYGFLYAEQFISVSLATVVYRTFPLLMLLFIPTILKEHVTKYQVVALLLGLAGLYIAGSGGTLFIQSNIDSIAILILIFVAIGTALGGVLMKRLIFDMESSLFIFSAANLILASVIFGATGFHTTPINLSSLIGLGYIGVVANVLWGFTYYTALRTLKTTFVTNIYFLSTFVTFIYSYFIFGEAILPYYLAIAFLVGAGLLIQRLDLKGGTYSKSRRELKNLAIFDVTSAFVNSKEAAIRTLLKNGGKVLAIKLHGKHRAVLESAINSSKTHKTNLFTDLHEKLAADEALFIREIMGVTPEEMVLLSAGEPYQSETELNEFAQRTISA